MEIIPTLNQAIALTLPFLVTMVALHVILFRPLYDHVEGREATSAEARREAEHTDTLTAEKLTLLEARLDDAQRAASELRHQARARAHEEEAAILAKARAEAEARVSEAVQEVAKAAEAASTELETTATALSRELASRVLGRDLAA